MGFRGCGFLWLRGRLRVKTTHSAFYSANRTRGTQWVPRIQVRQSLRKGMRQVTAPHDRNRNVFADVAQRVTSFAGFDYEANTL